MSQSEQSEAARHAAASERVPAGAFEAASAVLTAAGFRFLALGQLVEWRERNEWYLVWEDVEGPPVGVDLLTAMARACWVAPSAVLIHHARDGLTVTVQF